MKKKKQKIDKVIELLEEINRKLPITVNPFVIPYSPNSPTPNEAMSQKCLACGAYFKGNHVCVTCDNGPHI